MGRKTGRPPVDKVVLPCAGCEAPQERYAHEVARLRSGRVVCSDCRGKGVSLKPKRGVQLTCEVCRNEFYVPKNRASARFCSQVCHRVVQVKKVEYTCKKCGEAFMAAPSNHREFCSRACYLASTYKRAIDRQVNGKPAVMDEDGYIKVWDGERWVHEHRYVMSQHVGRPLTEDEHVHHKNRVRDDNALANLELLSGTAHARLTAAEVREREAERLALLGEVDRLREELAAVRVPKAGPVTERMALAQHIVDPGHEDQERSVRH